MLVALIVILVFSMVIFIHELGHLIFAKRALVGVRKFGIGFGPLLFRFVYKGTAYSIHLFPLGGFVSLKGLDDEEKDEPLPNEGQNFYERPMISKFAVIGAGPLANVFLAFLIYFSIFWLFGVPKEITNEIASTMSNSSAAVVGLRKGDQIIGINNIEPIGIEKIVETIHKNADKSLSLTIIRKDQKFMVNVVPKPYGARRIGRVGFTLKVIREHYGFFPSLQLAGSEIIKVTALTFYALKGLILGQISLKNLAGPVGIASLTAEAVQYGAVYFLQFVAFLSTSLGIFNLLPFPPLDGGRLVFLGFEMFKRPLSKDVERVVNNIGFGLLMFLMIIITYGEIRKLIFRNF
jgi:regulator of sigma E protease